MWLAQMLHLFSSCLAFEVVFLLISDMSTACILKLVFQIRTLEDQIENSTSGFKNAKTEEMSLKRLVTVKREKLAAVEIKLKKIYENTELQKQAITEYEYC